MSDRLSERLAATGGILYVVLLFVGSSITGGGDGATSAEASAQEYAQAAAGGTVTAVAYLLELLGLSCFLFFLGGLWGALRRAEGDGGPLSAAAFGGGLLALTLKFVSVAPVIAAVYRAGEGLDPQIARMVGDMSEVTHYLSFFPLVVLLTASAIVVLRTGALPRWLGWMAAAVAVLLLGGTIAAATYDWAGLPFLLFLLWTLATSVVLLRRAGNADPAARHAPATAYEGAS